MHILGDTVSDEANESQLLKFIRTDIKSLVGVSTCFGTKTLLSKHHIGRPQPGRSATDCKRNARRAAPSLRDKQTWRLARTAMVSLSIARVDASQTGQWP